MAPGERCRIAMSAHLPAIGKSGVRGEFDAAGRPVCAFRLCGSVRDITTIGICAMPRATSATAWTANIADDGSMTIEAQPGGAVL
jgi:hypothetical protein